jgi:hypothetical protein
MQSKAFPFCLMTRFNEFYSIFSQPHHYLMIPFYSLWVDDNDTSLIATEPGNSILTDARLPLVPLTFRSGHSKLEDLAFEAVCQPWKGEKVSWKVLKTFKRTWNFEYQRVLCPKFDNSRRTIIKFIWKSIHQTVHNFPVLAQRKPLTTINFAVFTITEQDNIISTQCQKNIEQTMIIADCL